MKSRCTKMSQLFGLLGAAALGLLGIARAEVAGYDKTEFMISMRDGVRLHTLVYQPQKQAESLPIILLRTPYGVDAAAPRALDDYLKDLAEDGYVFAFQDIRGRYKSEGAFVMIRPPRRNRGTEGDRRGHRCLRHDRVAGQEPEEQQRPGGDVGNLVPGLAHGNGLARAAPGAQGRFAPGASRRHVPGRRLSS